MQKGLNKLIVVLIVLIACVQIASAASIDSWNNSISGDSFLKPDVQEGETIQFNISGYSGVAPITFHWFRNGTNQSHNSSTYSTSWPDWGDSAEVTCYITDGIAGQSRNITWTPTITVLKAGGIAEQIDTTRPDEFITGVEDLDLEAMLDAEMNMYIDLMGPMFFLLILGVPFVMIWIRSESLVIPGGLGLIIGVMLLGFMPTPYQAPIVLIIVISIMSVIIGIYKDRK